MMNYTRVNWENGTKSKDGYVTIDGVQYTTVEPEYTGNTPVDSDNLNVMDKGIDDIVKWINKMKPATLFEQTDDETSGITLSESPSKYKKIRVYYKTGDNQLGKEEVFNNGKSSFFMSVFKGSETGNNPVFYARVCRIVFNDKNVTLERNGNFDIKTGTSNNTFTADTNAVTILKIEGLEPVD